MKTLPRTHASRPPSERQRVARIEAHTEAPRASARINTRPDPAPLCRLPAPHNAPRAYRTTSRPHSAIGHKADPLACVRGLVLGAALLCAPACAPKDEPITSERIAQELAASPQLRREVANLLLEDRALVRMVARSVVTDYRQQLRGEQGIQGPQGEQGPRGLASAPTQSPAASYCTRLCGEDQQDEAGNVCKGGRWVSPRDLCGADEDCPQNQGTIFGLRWACVQGVCQRAACNTDNECGALEVCRPYSLAPASLQ